MITGDEAGFDAFVAGRQAGHWTRIHTSPEAYVRRAMYHQNISWWRRRRIAESPLLGHDGTADAADTDLRLTLDQALARLTAKQRTVLVLPRRPPGVDRRRGGAGLGRFPVAHLPPAGADRRGGRPLPPAGPA